MVRIIAIGEIGGYTRYSRYIRDIGEYIGGE